MRQSVLITGCTTGSAGHALAKEYHARGLHVFATARRLESMSDLANISNMTLLTLDVTSISSIKSAVASVQASLGAGLGLDILVNNAGVASTTPALDHQIEDIRSMFETNVFGMMSMVQEFMPLLVLSKDAVIVNVGSVAALVPFAFGSSYNASKAAVHSYSDTLRVELRPLNIKVVTVVLGGVRSNIYSYSHKPLPSNSYYIPIENIWRSFRKKPAESATTPEAFARDFVPQTLRAFPPRRMLSAKGSTFMSLVAALMPRWLLEWATAKVMGLDKLPALLKAEGKTK